MRIVSCSKIVDCLLLLAFSAGCATFEPPKTLAHLTPVVEEARGQVKVSDQPGRLQAGAGKARLTPPVGTPLAGYAKRGGKPSTGVHDDLYARAVALGDGEDLVILISAEIQVIPPRFTTEVLTRLNEKLDQPIGLEDLILAATHTHAGPGAYMRSPLGQMTGGKFQAPVRERVMAACVHAALLAVRSMQPAKMATGETRLPELVENRYQVDRPTEGNLTALQFTDDNDKPIATIVNFAAHPTTLDYKNQLLSGDFPGELSTRLEKRQPGSVALFFNAAAGDLRPTSIEALSGFDLSAALGQRLAEATLAAVANAKPQTNIEVASLGGEFPLPPARLKFAFIPFPRWLIREWIPENASFNLVALGDVVLVTCPADVTSDIGVHIRGWLASRGLKSLVVTYANDFIGYVVNQWVDEHGGYKGNRMAWHGTEMESVWETIVFSLAEEYLTHLRAVRESALRSPGMPVVVLKGTPYEMGFEHGSRYKSQVRASVTNILSFMERQTSLPVFRRLYSRYKLSRYWAKMKRYVPKRYLEEMKGLADGSGVSLRDLQRVHALPEFAAVWCASSVAYGKATEGGRLLHLRNLDWSIHSDIQRYAAAFVVHPEGKSSFVNLGYFGFIGALTGISKEGISAAEIGAATVDRTLKGIPMPFLLRRVLEEAGDLKQAVDIVQSAKRTTGYQYVFADAKTKQAVTIETTRRLAQVFWAENQFETEVSYAVPIQHVLVRADTAIDPQVRDRQLASQGNPSRRGIEAPGGEAYNVRYKRHSDLIQKQYGRLNARGMIEIAKEIAPDSNIQSVVFAYPVMWVANARGSDPAVSQPYVKYDLRALFQGRLREPPAADEDTPPEDELE